MLRAVTERLWGKQSNMAYLLSITAILLLTYLGTKDIWTQEHRWVDIVLAMFSRQDFLHPYLDGQRYYDKPLLSYWLIAGLAFVTDSLSTWVFRLPSVCAGAIAVCALYRLGYHLRDKALGMLSAWMLVTTFFFVFWARTSSADMLNLAGIVLAIAWYFGHKEKSGLFSYSIFFLILAVTALCKGLVGVIVPALAVFTDITLNRAWHKHLRPSLFVALLPALLVYLAPFVASSYFGGESYGENGLYMVYRENILRYFEPFDHKGSIFTYFIYLPIYMLPWTLLFIPALVALRPRWRSMTRNSKWIAWSLLVIFLFFTLSGSRRSYYVLPLVPFGILLTADWLLSAAKHAKRLLVAAGVTVFGALLIFVFLDVLPHVYYSQYGLTAFARVLEANAAKTKPLKSWHVAFLDAEPKVAYYLKLQAPVQRYNIIGHRENQTNQSLVRAWSVLNNPPKDTIFVTRARYVPFLQTRLKNYALVKIQQPDITFLREQRENAPVAFVPTNE